MKQTPAKPLPPPPGRRETARQAVARALEKGPLTAHELSVLAGVSEKDLPDILEHLRKSLRAEGRRLAVRPAACLGCGHLFAKRERLSAPGRCPVCRDTHIREPAFGVEGGK